jgi:pectate lyase/fibronectin type 3 domain-containing protein
MFKQTIKTIVFALIALTLTASAAFAADGWAGQNGGTTGGAGGTTVTVSTAADFINYAMNSGQTPYIIQVSGNINLGSSNVRVRGNKTIIGLSGSHISGNLKCYTSIESNNIFKNLDMDNKADVGDGDCIGIDGVQHIWIDHCTFTDGGDGNVDIKNGSDYVTVSWCIFKYTYDSGHNFSNLIGHSDGNGGTDTGHLLVTFHHNWYSTLCKERMPRVRFGKVHLYNNYYDSAGNNYCIGVGNNCNIRVESNYFNSVTLPWKDYRTNGVGIIGWDSDNVFTNTTIPTWATNSYSSVFAPPYSYTTDDGLSVPGVVMAGAGAGGSQPPPTIPPTPTNLTATAGNAQVSLSWSASSGATSYNVKRSTTSGGPYTTVASPTSTSYTNTGLTNGTTYYYVVSAVNSAGQSANSSQVSATPTAGGGTVPPVPTNLTATAGNAQVSLSWSASSGATSYNVKRSTTSGGPYTTVASPTSTSYTNTGLTNGTTYYYVVSAVNSVGQSANSSQVSATPAASGGAPAAPSNLVATGASRSIVLTWNDNSSNETGFQIERSTSATGSFSLKATVGANVKTWTNTGLTTGKAYWYRVRAINASGNSAYSNVATATAK